MRLDMINIWRHNHDYTRGLSPNVMHCDWQKNSMNVEYHKFRGKIFRFLPCVRAVRYQVLGSQIHLKINMIKERYVKTLYDGMAIRNCLLIYIIVSHNIRSGQTVPVKLAERIASWLGYIMCVFSSFLLLFFSSFLTTVAFTPEGIIVGF